MSEDRTLTSAERKAWRALYETHGLVTRRIESDLHAAGVGSLSDYAVLYALYEAPGKSVRLAELADAGMLSRSGLTRLVDRLESDGYLRREPFLDDRRGTLAVLTDAGTEEMRRIWKIYSAGIARYFAAQLSETEAEGITATLRRVVSALGGD
ncbi:MAG: MarR family transcriptional regulator [Akkermansiaceae bacterium]|nr:MarR family transcriptional regulator [Armatimonadota bacterium]